VKSGKAQGVRRAGVLVFVVPLFLAACSSKGPYQLNLMPAPKIYSEKEINPFEAVDERKFPYSGILYATDRLPVTGDSKEDFYENERGHVLRFGLGKIKLGKENLNWEQAKEVSLLKNRGKDYPLQVTEVEELGVLDSSRSQLIASLSKENGKSANKAFASLINQKLSTSQTKDVYVYIHGYKVVFSNPLLVAAELWHFLGYDGAFVAYAWPSTPSRWAYAKDLETAAYSSRNLRLMLEYLAKETNARRIHIVAYSAGTRVAINALSQLALLNKNGSKNQLTKKLRIGHVILVGSDSDRGIFAGHLEDGLLNVMDDFTIYMSDTDKALGVSKFVFARRRLGQVFASESLEPAVRDYLRGEKDLNLIDVTEAEEASAGNGHAYFRKSPWVSSDVLMTLKYDLTPGERGLLRHKELPTWVFPENYTERLRQQLKTKIGLK
jgi:esterase/lipase superfamily enzyme